MPFISRQWTFRLLGWGGLSVVVILLLHPWVLAPLIPHLLNSQGIQVERCRIKSYLHWVLEDVSFEREGVAFRAEEVQLRNPGFWFWENPPFLFSGDVLVTVEQWRLELEPRPAREVEEASPSLLEILEKMSLASSASSLHQMIDTLNRWVPTARAEEGQIQQGDRLLKLDTLTWMRGSLTGQGKAYPGAYPLQLQLDRTMKGLQAEMEFGDGLFSMEASTRMQRNGSLQLQSRGLLLSGPYRLEGVFPSEETWPEFLILEWDQPDRQWVEARIPGLRPDRNQFLAEMSGQEWKLSWKATGLWENTLGPNFLPGNQPAAWKLDLALRGDASTATFQKVEIDSDLANLKLAEAFSVDYQEIQLSRPIRLTAAADFDDPFWGALPLQGQVNLDFLLERKEAFVEPIAFHFSGTGTHRQSASGPETFLDFQGSLNADQLVLQAMHFEQGASSLELAGTVSLNSSRDVQFDTSGVLGSEAIQALGYSDLPFSSVEFQGRVTGPAEALVYAGDLQIAALSIPGMHPLDLEWQTDGLGRQGGDWILTARGTETRLDFRGRIEFLDQAILGRLQKLTLRGRDQELVLEKALRLRFQLGSEDTPGTVSLLDPTQLRGLSDEPRSRILLSPLTFTLGQVPSGATLQVENLDLSRFQPWLVKELPNLKIGKLHAFTGNDLLVNATLTTQLAYTTEGLSPLQISVEAGYLEDVLEIEALQVNSRDHRGLFVEGRIPVRLAASPERFLDTTLLTENPLYLKGSVETGKPDLEFSNNSISLQLLGTQLSFQLEGTPGTPTGKITSTGKSLELAWKSWEAPLSARDWQLEAVVNPKSIRFQADPLIIQETRFRLEAALPLTDTTWTQLREADYAQLGKAATFTVSAPDLKLEQWKEFLPESVAPQGQAEVAVTYTALSGMEGFIQIEGVTLNPGSAQMQLADMKGRLHLQGYEGTLEPIQFNLNNRPAKLSGSWAWNFQEKVNPVFNFRIQGEGVPLVRESDLLLRSDLDLRLQRESPDSRVRLSGEAQLRDGLFLRPFLEFVQPGTASARRQPPYFSIEAEPYRNWELDVALKGDPFMRVNAPVAQGVLSADLQLLGTLENPYLLGSITADRGILKLPFGVIRLDRGMADFGVDRPYDPAISVRGTSKTLGYVIDVLVSGSLENPDIQFESDPSLSPDEILLLLTAGVLPDSSDEGSLSQSTSGLALYVGRGYLSDLFGGSGTERLRIRSGESLSESGRETFQVEYDLSDDLSVIGEYDEYDDYNVDLRWRVRTGK